MLELLTNMTSHLQRDELVLVKTLRNLFRKIPL